MAISPLRSDHHRLLLFLLLLLSSISFSSQQNFQAFFPPNSIPAFRPPPAAPPPAIPSSPAPSAIRPNQPITTPPPGSPPPSQSRGTRGSSVAVAVVGTAFGTFALCSIVFFVLYRRSTNKYRLPQHNSTVSGGSPPYGKANGHSAGAGGGTGGGGGGYDMKILDGEGLDAFYVKRLEDASRKLHCRRCSKELDEADREELVVRVNSSGGGGGGGGGGRDEKPNGNSRFGRKRKDQKKQQQEDALLGTGGSPRSDDHSWSGEFDQQHQSQWRPPPQPRPPRPPRGQTSFDDIPPWAYRPPPSMNSSFDSTQQQQPHQSGYGSNFAAVGGTGGGGGFGGGGGQQTSYSPVSGTPTSPNPPLPLPPGRMPPAGSTPPYQSGFGGPGGSPSSPPAAGPSAPSVASFQNAPPPPPPPGGPGAPPLPPPPGKPGGPPPPPVPGKSGGPPPPPPPGKAGGPPPPPPPGKGPPPPPGKGPPPPPPGKGPPSRPPAPPGMGKSGELDADGIRRRPSLPPPAKLKPLHWDKMNAVNTEHSMVWDKIHDGSFRFDDDLMESLFGTVATNRKTTDPRAGESSTAPPAQIVLLDPRKSQNTAIVLRSLAISRQEILDALRDGHGLTNDNLEKLSKIAPTKDDEATILGYTGDPSKLADAESFLFHILRAVQAPFSRVDSMLFRSTFDNEATAMRESLQVLEAACGELKKRGLFVKLLEAVLKAGNRMNAGTARGNAKAFNLASLRKLSDVKSTDGKTTLLHFVVEEVIRSEGKRCVLNRDQGFGKNNNAAGGKGKGDDAGEGSDKSKEEEREFMMLGLPIVGGLSAEFAHVKRAAGIDYDALVQSWAVVDARLRRARLFLGTFKNGADDPGFVKEMKQFLESAEAQVYEIDKQKERVMELVRRTTEYYHSGAQKEKGLSPLHLFGIVKDFLGMVDQACIGITRNIQLQQQQQQLKKKLSSSGSGASGSSIAAAGADSPSNSGRLPSDKFDKFPNLPKHFLSDHLSRNSSAASGSDSDEDDFSP